MEQYPDRVNESIFREPERRALDWMVERIPALITPHHLTAIGFLGGVTAGFGFALSTASPSYLFLGILGIILNWLGDSLDGTLARHRGKPSRAGAFADHALDAASELAIFVGIGLSPFVRLDIALLALAGYFLLTILTMSRALVGGVFRITFLRIGPTEARAGAIALALLMFFNGAPTINVVGMTWTFYDILVLGFAFGSISLYFVLFYRMLREL